MSLIRPESLHVSFGIHGETFLDESPFVVDVNGLYLTEEAAKLLSARLLKILDRIEEEKGKI